MPRKPEFNLDGLSLEDDEVRAAIQELALDVVKSMRTMYNMGDPGLRLQIGKAFMPLLVKAMSKDQESEDIAMLKEQLAAIQEQITNTAPTRLKVVNGEVIAEDTPPNG